MKNLNDILNNFGFASLVDVHIFKLKSGKKYGKVLSIEDFDSEKCIYLDTLKLCNIKEKGSKYVFKSGEFNVPVRRIGNTISIEIKDALGKTSTLKDFFNLQIDGHRLYRSNIAAQPFALEGKVETVNLQGQTNHIYIFIPCFLPSGTLELLTSIEQEFGVFDLSGEIFPVFFTNEKTHLEWYSFSPYSILDPRSKNPLNNKDAVYIIHSFKEPIDADKTGLIYNGDIVQMEPLITNTDLINTTEEVILQQTHESDTSEYYHRYLADQDSVQIRTEVEQN